MSIKHFAFILIFGSLVIGCQNRDSGFYATAPGPTPIPALSASPKLAVLPETSLYNLTQSWVDQNGKEFKLKSLRGCPQVIAIIYASCKGACPRIINDMLAVEALVEKKTPNGAGYVLVTMDPERDTPERLQALATELKLGKNWKLLHGSPDQVQELAATLGVRYRKISDTDFAHSNTVSVLDADGNLAYQKESLGQNIEDAAQAVGKYVLPAEACCH